MVDEAAQKAQEIEDHRLTYNSVMRFSGEVGVPASLGLTAFFTNLVMGNGLIAIPAFIITYIATAIFVKLFFSH